MRLSCLINNYNYGAYVADAVRSALDQTAPLDEVIVVDDGSTDDSIQTLNEVAAGDPRVTLVEKANGGQLSAFEAGFAHTTGDLVFFLDADDLYEPGYVARMMGLYTARPDVDFAFCGSRMFGGREGVALPHPRDRDLGCSAVATALDCRSVGAATSCLSMRRWVLERVLPGPPQEEWRVCADACLVYGSSLAGARKYAVAEPLVRRRIHEANAFENRHRDAAENYRRRLRVAGLVGHYAARYGLTADRLAPLVRQEFRSIPRPTRRELSHYTRLAMGLPAPVWRRLSQAAGVASHFVRTRGKAEPPVAPSIDPVPLSETTRRAA